MPLKTPPVVQQTSVPGRNAALAPSAAKAVTHRVERLAATMQAIEVMNLEELRVVWQTHFGPPPALRSVDLMRLMLSWRLQARTYGGVDAALRRKLRSKAAADAVTDDLANGTILIRDWQGQRVEVTVEEGGFRWLNQVYPSLSAVASAVTGTRWNGPRFFGLRGGKV